MSTDSPILQVSGVSKTFGRTRAVDDVTFEVLPAEIHAVIGENGAGKSTLMNLIGGFLSPDRGSVEFLGQNLPIGDSRGNRARGVRVVHQHFMLVPAFTVAENLALATQTSLASRISSVDFDSNLQALAKSLGWSFDFSLRTSQLSVGAQQRVEILKALTPGVKLLILDEPTAVLSPGEVAELFEVLRKLKTQGVTILLIAHKLKEVMDVADRITVLRGGKLVGTFQKSETSIEALAELMVGKVAHDETVVDRPVGGAPVLRIQSLSVKGSRGELAVNGIDLELSPGEVFGIGGVDGNGQVELAESIVGIRPPENGSIWCDLRIGYIPPDRQHQGLALSLSVLDNFLVGGLENNGLFAGPFVRWPVVRQWANRLIKDYSIRVSKIQDPIDFLSGGNQQKVVVARVMAQKPGVLVAVNPTRGLDFQAAAFVHDSIVRSARDGAAVILVTTDSDELDKLSMRKAYLSRGRFVDRLVGADT